MKSDNTAVKNIPGLIICGFFVVNIYDIIPQSSCSNKVVMIKSKLSVEKCNEKLNRRQ